MAPDRSEPSVQEHLDENHHLDESRVGSTKEELYLVGYMCKSSYHLGEMRNS